LEVERGGEKNDPGRQGIQHEPDQGSKLQDRFSLMLVSIEGDGRRKERDPRGGEHIHRSA